MNYVIFTDGASRGNPGPGGWGAVVISSEDKTVLELGGSEKKTTNNRMELTAAMEGLKRTQENSEVTIYTDSSYLINGITKWVKGWKKIGWITRAKDEVLNRDLWELLDELNTSRAVKWLYVGGHAGIPGNERCDIIATSFAGKRDIELYSGPLVGYNIKNILEIKAAETKLETKSRRDTKAYSYISLVKGEVKIHHSWPECEKRVKGVKGARYKKSLSAEDEEKVIAEFSAI